MDEVLVKVYATLKDKMGWGEQLFPAEAKTLAELFKQAKGKRKSLYDVLVGESGKLLPHFAVMVNGRDVEFLRGLETEIKPGDTVVVFPPVAGGAVVGRLWSGSICSGL